MDTDNHHHHHHHEQPEFQENQGVNFSPNGLKQTFDKNENDEILILEEKLYFSPGSEQVKIPLDILGIDEIDAIGSFSITMNVKVSTNLKDIKNDQIFFQIGSSVMNKTLVLGITRDRTFFASCLTQKNKLETCYTQCKVKNTEYHVGVTVVDEGTFSELTIFVNGQNEASLVFPSAVDSLQGYFVYGSDSPVDGFLGEISEAMFYVKVMHPHDMKECFNSRRTSPDKSIYLIRKEKKDFLNATDYYSKKKGLPVNLVRTHGVETKQTKKEGGEEQKKPENANEEAKKQKQMEAMIEELKDLIYQDETLYFHVRDIGFNFEWIFKVCSVLSPVIEDKGSQPKHSFPCLHNSLCEGEARYYPCYAITVDQFMKVVAKIDTKLEADEVIKLAERIDCFDVNKEFGNFIYYDKFLLAVRNAAFSREEIKYINKARNDDVEKQVIRTERTETEAAAPGQPQVTSVVTAYNLIPIFENADYFDQKDFIEANPDAVLVKIILSIYKPTNHIRFIHFAYKLKDGKIHEFEVGKPITSGLDNMVHFTIDINDDEFLTGVKASNYHSNNANKLISYLSFSLNTHPDGIAYGQFTGHPGELKTLNFDPSEYKDKKILGFYGAFRDELIGLGVYVKEKVIIKPTPVPVPVGSPEEAKQTEVAVVEPEEEEEDYVLTLPQVKQEWNEGRIQIVINRCADCNQHKTTTSHHEADFCMKFNEWGNRIKDYFPNAEIIGNYDKPKVFGIFEIYIRGVGPNHDRDNEGRIFLHQNYTTPEMKTSFAKVLETLMIYCFEYGDSIEMGKAQGAFIKKHAHEIPKKFAGCHDHPVDVPERVTQTQSKKGGKGKIEDGTQVVCQHWACGQRYSYDSMNESICTHHPGRYEFGSVHGLWPEGWTCCRGNWEDRGCKRGKHAPIPVNRYYQLCINHGDLNPKTGKPDSACGRSYQDSSDECKFHQGYLIGRGATGKWTCCGEAGETAPPCASSSHKGAEWPDEEAKLYFVTRDIRNPGIYRDSTGAPSFANKVTNSGYYRKTKPYTIYENPQRKRAKEMEETENETRVCMNWGCSHTYKEADNKKVKHCRSHPGVWDFGYTGITVSQAISEFNRDNSDVLLWKPHWTCCRMPWTTKGCTKTHHRGPLATEAIEPKYKWPSEDAQKFFRKTVSPLWKAKLENQYMLEPAQVAQKFDDFAKTMGGKINIGMLPQFCDKLRLHLLVISEDLSNHIRFLQVVNHIADPVLDDGQGNIDKKKFLEWWYAKLDE